VTDRRWGHVKLSRKFFEEDEWWNEKRPKTKAEAWLDCIYMAAWKARKFSVGLEVEHLARGEFMASLRFLATRWRWSRGAVERWIAAAQKAGRIVRQREGQAGTVYLVANYELYQGNDPPTETRRETPRGTAVGQQRDKIEAGKARQEDVRAIPGGWPAEFSGMYEPVGLLVPGRLGRTLKPLVDRYGVDRTREMWAFYVRHAPHTRFGKLDPDTRDTSRMSPEDFVRNAGTWYAKTQPLGGPSAATAS
jgi:hypothetical protein